ncbi:hypothetical protein SG34_007040 [Thalassomonas viridans]|uniref:Uncharacterized protein n=1 Tax=Thalassomonas viridans TaxID=137584 RepID=A0AAE9Z4T0_9GAMM|nr:hypothetical protein [Thalassomonas viridans]WDE06655.1 hypothetical protein SG34_007040 [Thalassomonas viridans]
MKSFSYYCCAVIALSSPASIVNAEEKLYQEYPDAFICLHEYNGNTYERIYRLSIASNVHLRYDGPNPDELIHYHASTGSIDFSLSPPSYVDCVSKNMTIKQLVENGRGLEMYTPTPSGRKYP